MVDTRDLKSLGETHAGSSPALGTNKFTVRRGGLSLCGASQDAHAGLNAVPAGTRTLDYELVLQEMRRKADGGNKV